MDIRNGIGEDYVHGPSDIAEGLKGFWVGN
jgi:hypothetical protein